MRKEKEIKEVKTKILFTLPVELKEEMLLEAEADHRSLNNYILNVLLKRNK
jgi:predicted HicB family RNase H-like nuclease